MTAVVAPLNIPTAAAQTQGTFDYSPHQAAAGSFLDVVARCLRDGTAAGVQLLVLLDQNDGTFDHQQTYAPQPDGSLQTVFDIPRKAPPGSYTLYGSCYANGTRFFQRAGAFQVSPPAGPGVTTQVKGKTLVRESSGVTPVLRALVVFAALASALLVGFGEWSRRHPAGNHHRSRA